MRLPMKLAILLFALANGALAVEAIPPQRVPVFDPATGLLTVPLYVVAGQPANEKAARVQFNFANGTFTILEDVQCRFSPIPEVCK